MITQIVFFNHYHNGDLFVSKEFVRNIKKQIGNIFDIKYLLFNHHKTLLDLNISYAGYPIGLNDRCKFILFGEILYVNTWIGAYQFPYADPPHFYKGGINYLDLHEMWKYIFKEIEKYTSIKLIIDVNPEFYIPQIDYSQFNVSIIDNFVSDKKDIVLVCNGQPMSNQSELTNLNEIIKRLSIDFKEKTFVCTKKFDFADNIYFTENIINLKSDLTKTPYWNQCTPYCDLNEISYLSTFCDVIIGRNSGPYIYCTTKNNMMDNSKKFIQFNRVLNDNLFYGIKSNCTNLQQTEVNIEKNYIFLKRELCQ